MSNPSVFPQRNLNIPDDLNGIIQRLETVQYPLAGFRNCADQRQFDRYQGAQDVIDLLRTWQKALTSET
jgi:hypothetical protein